MGTKYEKVLEKLIWTRLGDRRHLDWQYEGEMVVATRGVHGSIKAVFFQIYYRTDRDRFFHNWNRCTLPRVDFPTYSGAV